MRNDIVDFAKAMKQETLLPIILLLSIGHIITHLGASLINQERRNQNNGLSTLFFEGKKPYGKLFGEVVRRHVPTADQFSHNWRPASTRTGESNRGGPVKTECSPCVARMD
ncbi:MAG: hypothetical protein DME22_19480 [Verrucomicrobia bacterium]|nr:MAG: hypothetical protein DME22_19480 [Verrucomicrobiota bacterium]